MKGFRSVRQLTIKPLLILGAATSVIVSSLALSSNVKAYQYLCGNPLDSPPSFSCVAHSGFTGQSPWGYPVDVNGHNCTNYVTYRLWKNLVTNPGNLGHAKDWDNNALAYGIPVDNTPAVGTVAVWEANSGPALSSGHVAYVESVTSTYIETSEDNWGGSSTRVRYYFNQPGFPDHFIHFKDIDNTTDIAWFESWNGGKITIAKSGTTGPMNGTTTYLTGYGKPDWAGTGDFDGDGKQDIAWYESGPGTITMAYGNGDGGVQSYYTFLSGWGKPDWAGVGDFNNDGKDDVVWYEAWNNGTTTIAYGSSSGPVGGYSIFRTGQLTPTWAGIGDFNGDGKADIAWYRASTSNVLVSYGNGSGGWQSQYHMISGWGTAAWTGVGDFNNDGKSDIAWYESWNNGTITIAKGSASGPMAGTVTYKTGLSTPTWASVGDFNGDEKQDIVWYHSSTGSALAYYGAGNGTASADSYYIIGGWGAPDWAGVGNFAP